MEKQGHNCLHKQLCGVLLRKWQVVPSTGLTGIMKSGMTSAYQRAPINDTGVPKSLYLKNSSQTFLYCKK